MDFTFSATSDNERMGSVQTLAAPSCTNPLAVIYATANRGYRFVCWNDSNTVNPRTIAVTCDTSFVAIFDTLYEGTEGINDAELVNARVYTTGCEIVVEGLAGHTVRLYDISGRLLERRDEGGDRVKFLAPASGTYVLRIGDRTVRKVMVIR